MNKLLVCLIVVLALLSMAPGCPGNCPTPEKTEPVTTEPPPQETEPVETEPVETEPVETEPVETEPVETPEETEPVSTEPVTTESVDTPEPQATDDGWPDFVDDGKDRENASLPSGGGIPAIQLTADASVMTVNNPTPPQAPPRSDLILGMLTLLLIVAGAAFLLLVK